MKILITSDSHLDITEDRIIENYKINETIIDKANELQVDFYINCGDIFDSAKPSIKSYVHWKSIEFSKNVPMGDKDRKRNQYWDERRIALSFDLAFSLDDYLDAKYSEYKRTIKR